MGSFESIQKVSSVLRGILQAGLKDENGTDPFGVITLNPPSNVTTGEALSFWLYQAVENEFMRNTTPPPRGPQTDQEQFPPLTINLLFLLTPIFSDQNQVQLALGRSMQILHDHPRIQFELNDERQEFSVILARRTLEELTRIWDALREPYRLSVCYEVRLTRIDSLRWVRAARITDRAVTEEQTGVAV
jgi:hypothetical protein